MKKTSGQPKRWMKAEGQGIGQIIGTVAAKSISRPNTRFGKRGYGICPIFCPIAEGQRLLTGQAITDILREVILDKEFLMNTSSDFAIADRPKPQYPLVEAHGRLQVAGGMMLAIVLPCLAVLLVVVLLVSGLVAGLDFGAIVLNIVIIGGIVLFTFAIYCRCSSKTNQFQKRRQTDERQVDIRNRIGDCDGSGRAGLRRSNGSA